MVDPTKVFRNSLETCIYLHGDELITVKCLVHDLVFQTKYENVKRDKRAHFICPKCKEDFRNRNKVKVVCAYCKKEFFKSKSKSEVTKSGLHFCCREHKDKGQRVESSLALVETYKANLYTYRKLAFRNYPHECAVCRWNEDNYVLEVHHIDENRLNNELDNLIILCPTCHKKLTTHRYILIDRKEIRPIY